MSPDYPLDYEPATPEYVLEVFREAHRAAVAVREADPDEEPAFDTPIGTGTLRWLWDPEAVDTINRLFGAEIPFKEWNSTVAFTRGQTLSPVCELIARHARRPVLRPWRHLSGECLPAGAFLTVRAIRARRGADSAAVTPSAPLWPYLRRYGDSLADELAVLAPGRLPPLARGTSRVGFLLALLGGLPLLVSVAWKQLGIPWAGTAALVAFGMLVLVGLPGVVLCLWADRQRAFENLHTFRDLAYCLAGQEPPRRVQHTA